MLGLIVATGESEGRTPVLRERIGRVKPRVAWGLVVLLVVAASVGFVDYGDQPATEASSVDPPAVVRGLPVDSTAVFFVEAGLVGQRPALKEEIEHGYEILAQRTAGVLTWSCWRRSISQAPRLDSRTEVPVPLSSRVTSVSGDFERFPTLLQQAPSSANTDRGSGPSRALDPYWAM